MPPSRETDRERRQHPRLTCGRSRLATWRRPHLNARAVVALIALSCFLAPGVAAVIAAML